MTPSEIRAATLQQLRATRTAMMSAAWVLPLESKDAATQAEAAQKLVEVQQTILKLENAQLSEIRDALIANEAQLSRRIDKLGQALSNLKQVKTVLKAVTAVIETAAKVITKLPL